MVRGACGAWWCWSQALSSSRTRALVQRRAALRGPAGAVWAVVAGAGAGAAGDSRGRSSSGARALPPAAVCAAVDAQVEVRAAASLSLPVLAYRAVRAHFTARHRQGYSYCRAVTIPGSFLRAAVCLPAPRPVSTQTATHRQSIYITCLSPPTPTTLPYTQATRPSFTCGAHARYHGRAATSRQQRDSSQSGVLAAHPPPAAPAARWPCVLCGSVLVGTRCSTITQSQSNDAAKPPPAPAGTQ